MAKYDFLPENINRKRRILGRILNRKELPTYVYRLDTRDPAAIRGQGFQPRKDDGTVTAIEHVKNTLSPGHANYQPNHGVPAKSYSQWVSTAGYGFFQPIDPTFAHHLANNDSYIYKIDTTVAIQTGPFVDANSHFDKAGIRRPYATQREWIKLGGINDAAIVNYMTATTMGQQMDNKFSAPTESTLTGWLRF